MIDGSQVLDSGTLSPHSMVKNLILYALIGLVAGLAIGLGFAIIRELVSDRLRRRDDIVAALGAPVRLSVGPVSKGRLRLGRRRGARRDLALRRIAAYLRNVALRQGGDSTTLAVVAVDNAQEIAPAVAMLTKRYARDGREVVVADLVRGAPVARLLGATGTGPQPVQADGGSVVVFTPEDAGQVATGPLRPTSATGAMLLAEPAGEAVESAARQAGFLITVTELDPAVGAEHLSTWATEAVAVFTAGRTRAATAYAVGEMLRLSGVRAISGVITGSDTTDDSLGSVPGDAAVLASLRTARTGTAARRRRRRPHSRQARGGGPVSSPAVAARRAPRLAPKPAPAAAERSARRWVLAAWLLLVLNVMTFYPKTWSGQPLIVPIPSEVGKLITQGALPAALLIALAVNRRKLIRPSVYLGLYCLLIVELVIGALAAHKLGTTYRVFRLTMFVATLWLLTPWWGRKDVFLVKCHLGPWRSCSGRCCSR